MTRQRQQLGLRGERLAERFLKRQGFKTLARRYDTPAGELDLIMRDSDTIVFIEVKTRSDRNWTDPQYNLGHPQRRHLTKAAAWYIHRHRLDDRPCRFDVVAIVLPDTGDPEIEHFRDAFPPTH